MEPPKVAKEIMVTDLVTLPPNADVFESIRLLVRRSITGAPIVDAEGNYIGVFSEKCCMSLFTLAARLAAAEGVNAVNLPRASEFMSSNLVTLSPETDVFDAIGRLLKNRISGVPIVDAEGDYLGVFSEKYSMSALIQGAYEQLPSTEVRAFMNTDPDRTITEDTDLLRCAEIFLKTIFRRLPVVHGRKVVGQVSRRDVLRHEQNFADMLRDHVSVWFEEGRPTGEKGDSKESSPANDVSRFMDTEARTITEETDLLAIAQFFLHGPYRRLPVLRGQKLVGQISRRDLLATIHRLIEIAPQREQATLYLSALAGGGEAVLG